MSATQHYRINLNEAIWQYQNKLISGTTLVYYYFRIRFAPGWKIRFSPQKICTELGITKDQFYRGLRRVKELMPN